MEQVECEGRRVSVKRDCRNGKERWSCMTVKERAACKQVGCGMRDRRNEAAMARVSKIEEITEFDGGKGLCREGKDVEG